MSRKANPSPDEAFETVDPERADTIHVGANKNYADRPQLDPLEAARPDVANAEAVVAKAERETRERMAAKEERERQQAEAQQAHAASSARRAAQAPKILTRSEFEELSLEDQAKFRAKNGTVTEDPGYGDVATIDPKEAAILKQANPKHGQETLTR